MRPMAGKRGMESAAWRLPESQILVPVAFDVCGTRPRRMRFKGGGPRGELMRSFPGVRLPYAHETFNKINSHTHHFEV